jgi:IclR family KDG regulon transcriptional repressor
MPKTKTPASETDTPDSGGVRSVGSTLDILEMLASANGDVGITELSAALKMPKGTVFRHAQTLVSRGYAIRTASSRYKLGVAAYLLGQAAAERVDLVGAAAPAIKDLVAATGQSVVLSTTNERGVVVLQTTIGPSPVEIGVRPNSVLAFHASAQGKVSLAFMPELATRPIEPLSRFTDFTITDRTVLDAELQSIRVRGWATAPEELMLGLNGLAAPVRDASERCVAAIAIVGSIQYLPRQPDAAHVTAILDAARVISSNLGYDTRRGRSRADA